MPSRIKLLTNKGIAKPPKWLPDNIHLEVMMGSVAYGVSDDTSDMDVYGFAMPPRHVLFPEEIGVIHGFDKHVETFDQYQQHHLKHGDDEYDFSIYNIVKFFRLCADNNPNMVDALFVPARCVLHMTAVGNRVRENRKMFLHKGCWHKFKGYAFSQLNKAKNKKPKPGSKRHELVEKYGYDTKFAYHIVRLLDEVEQILTEGDLDLTRSREILKTIRRGEKSFEWIQDFFESQESYLEHVYQKSELPYKPDEAKIKNLLMECIEMHYGTIKEVMINADVIKLWDEIENNIKTIRGFTG
jgi:predicted nucleotidyltransferase